MLECKNNTNHVLHKVLKDDQWNILCPPNEETFSSKFDITLLVAVIRSVIGLKPKGGWKIEELQQDDTSIGAFIFLAQKLRNEIIHGSVDSLKTFQDYWQRIREILIGLKFKDMASFDDLETCPLDKHIDTLTKLVDALESEVTDIANDMRTLKRNIADLKKDILLIQNSISKLENEKADKNDLAKKADKRDLELKADKKDVEGRTLSVIYHIILIVNIF